MTRRITIPDDHVALVLPNQLSDELMSLCKLVRIAPRSIAHVDNKTSCRKIAGDVMLALLEAKEV